MFVLWTWTRNKKEKYPAFGETCTNSWRNNYFQALCKFKKKKVERVEDNKTNMAVFSAKNMNVEKIEQKKNTY